jgi:hypothetical protein
MFFCPRSVDLHTTNIVNFLLPLGYWFPVWTIHSVICYKDSIKSFQIAIFDEEYKIRIIIVFASSLKWEILGLYLIVRQISIFIDFVWSSVDFVRWYYAIIFESSAVLTIRIGAGLFREAEFNFYFERFLNGWSNKVDFLVKLLVLNLFGLLLRYM